MKYHQGRFTPRYPEKYVGEVANIIYRSGWELKLMIYLDTQPNVLKWFSEELVIPYISPVDGQPHRYFVDVGMEYKTSSGDIKRAIIEVKPEKQTRMPDKPTRNTKRYLNEVTTYAVNQAKWQAATNWAKKNNWDFIILTERHLKV